LPVAQQSITAERAMLLVAALVDAVRRHVDDRGVLDVIGREVERIVTVEGAVASYQLCTTARVRDRSRAQVP
jgi:hypothetical protein